jgi:hypothetical protein
VTQIEQGNGATVVTLRKGLEIMRTRIKDVDVANGTVAGAIAMIRVRGRDKDLVASNDDLTKFWRVAYVGGDRHTGHVFKLTSMDPKATGPAFTEADFPPGSGLSVWEFGIGDRMAIKTGVSLRRTDGGAYEVYATSPFAVTLKGKTVEVSTDGKAWQPLAGKMVDGRVIADITAGQISASKCRMWVKAKQ